MLLLISFSSSDCRDLSAAHSRMRTDGQHVCRYVCSRSLSGLKRLVLLAPIGQNVLLKRLHHQPAV
eukprot:6177290-Pleurochrysis_carterae.AAC.4